MNKYFMRFTMLILSVLTTFAIYADDTGTYFQIGDVTLVVSNADEVSNLLEKEGLRLVNSIDGINYLLTIEDAMAKFRLRTDDEPDAELPSSIEFGIVDIDEITLNIEEPQIVARYAIGILHYANGNYRKASTNFELVADHINANPSAMLVNANALVLNEEYEAGKALLAEIIESDDDLSTVALHNRSILYFLTEDFDLALSDLNTAISAGLEISTAYNNRGVIYSAQGEHELAIDDYLMALELDPEHPQAIYNLATAKLESGQLDEALQSFSRALELNPESSDIVMNRGIVYFMLGNSEAAFDDYAEAIDLDPNNAEALFNLALWHQTYGTLSAAINFYSHAIREDSTYANAYTNRGVAYVDSNQLSKAFADFERALEINPDDAIAHYQLGLAYARSGSYSNAVDSFSSAIELNSDDGTYYRDRAMAYVYLNLPQPVIDDATRAIELGIDDAYLLRGIAYGFSGNPAGATADFDKYEEIFGFFPLDTAQFRAEMRQKAGS